FGSSCPVGATVVELDQNRKDSLVRAHNLLRQKWASGQGKIRRLACQMATIQWNEELAKLAQLNVKGCVMEHDTCHNTKEFPSSGQNLFMVGYWGAGDPVKIGDVLQEAVTNWAAEEAQITESDLQELPNNGDIRHLSVLINDKNVAVGCAIVSYLKDDIEYFLVVCNYGITNIVGQSIYSSCPKAGSQCSTKLNPNYSPLC
ncbi:hypothetical protein KR009_006369, partial [Drosophila setifemur]